MFLRVSIPVLKHDWILEELRCNSSHWTVFALQEFLGSEGIEAVAGFLCVDCRGGMQRGKNWVWKYSGGKKKQRAIFYATTTTKSGYLSCFTVVNNQKIGSLTKSCLLFRHKWLKVQKWLFIKGKHLMIDTRWNMIRKRFLTPVKQFLWKWRKVGFFLSLHSRFDFFVASFFIMSSSVSREHSSCWFWYVEQNEMCVH